MSEKITFDKKNYRKHSDTNKKKIKKSLQECGAGRSILVDKDGCLIAGNIAWDTYEEDYPFTNEPKRNFELNR